MFASASPAWLVTSLHRIDDVPESGTVGLGVLVPPPHEGGTDAEQLGGSSLTLRTGPGPGASERAQPRGSGAVSTEVLMS